MSDKFKYEYNAPTQEERKEIESIKNQYLPKDEKSLKLEQLRKLDNKVKSIPTSFGISMGIIGLLIFGLGLTFFLEWTNLWYLGIPFSFAGLLVVVLTYPVYTKVLSNVKNKYKDEIIKLSNELLNEEND